MPQVFLRVFFLREGFLIVKKFHSIRKGERGVADSCNIHYTPRFLAFNQDFNPDNNTKNHS